MADRGYSAYNIAKRAAEKPSIMDALASVFSDMGASDPGIGPMMIPTKGNLPMFQGKVKELAKALFAEYAPPGRLKEPFQKFTEALAYAKTRYPKIAGLVDKYYTTVAPLDDSLASFMKQDNSAMIGMLDSSGHRLPPHELVNSILHEARHGMSARRTPQLFDESLANPGSLSNFREELNATRAGNTAMDSYLKYLDLLFSLKGK